MANPNLSADELKRLQKPAKGSVWLDGRRRRKATNWFRDATCLVCKQVFRARRYTRSGWQRCCSFQCEVQRRAEHHPSVVIVCEACGATKRRYGSWARRRATHTYCSVECRAKHLRGPVSSIYRGAALPNRGQEWKRLAAEIRTRDGHSCQRCGIAHQPDEKNFPVDHIVPWRECPDKATANAPSNLVTLCLKCHAYKTCVVERSFLRGDRIGMQQYKAAITMPSLVARERAPFVYERD